jgi:exopolysaccharide biosynthesis WecB/TagA/CpsF family protein
MDIYNIFTSKIPASINDFDPRHKKLITFLNPHSYKLAFDKPLLFEKFDWIAPDGILLVLILNLFKAAKFKIKRFSCDMTSVAPFIFDIAIKNELSIYFLGADNEGISGSIETFTNAYPRLPVAGYRHGYFNTDGERILAIDEIIKLNPDIIFIGMGAILQETMALNLRERGFKGAVYTCGGFLHQSKTEINFYPNFINKLNLRFFYRVYKEEGFFARAIKTYPEFCALMIKRAFNKLEA